MLKRLFLTDNTTSSRIRCADMIIVNFDVDLHGRTLTLTKKVAIVFERSSVSNGELVFRKNKLYGEVKVMSKVSGSVINNTLYVNWFLKDNNLDAIYNSGILSLTGMRKYILGQVLTFLV